MSKMTIVQLGVIVFAICLSTQATEHSTNTTSMGNSTSNPNATTVATDTHSSSANTTGTNAAGVSLHAGTVSFLIPVTMAASLLQRYC
ncbi:hypothetical protein PBY51_006682 [Eleginops maclovinus]|uniref:Uncharacterized protein n=1 Tax=Eleginops maclovinus TaxID=56733 RepID=A0AAN7WWN9_ELEMC|nr:hypothetical protein PBY51_006682 [Eleginops maclovinus]